MSLKSEGAKAYIEEYQQDGFTHTADALKAVEIAESAARDRAVKAFKKTCDNYDNGNCELWYGVESERKCPGEAGCASIDKFLEKYDNE